MNGTKYDLLELLSERHSGRSYDANRPVTQEQLEALVKAAYLAPSCYNDQPWRFIICDRHQHSEAYSKVLNSLVEFNQQWANPAPVLVVIVAHTKFSKNQNPNRWGAYDTGAAAFAMMLQAADMGLMAHQMGGFDEKKIQKDFAISTDFMPMAVMSIGYEVKEEAAKTHFKDRRPANEMFYFGNWNSQT